MTANTQHRAQRGGLDPNESAALRGRFVVKNGRWIRSEDATYLTVRMPRGTDLSTPALRERALDSAIAAHEQSQHAAAATAPADAAEWEAELEAFVAWATNRHLSVERAGLLRRNQGSTFWEDATEAAWQRWKLTSAARAPQRTREQLAQIARESALASHEGPSSPALSADWQPPAWVLDALERAVQGEPA